MYKCMTFFCIYRCVCFLKHVKVFQTTYNQIGCINVYECRDHYLCKIFIVNVNNKFIRILEMTCFINFYTRPYRY